MLSFFTEKASGNEWKVKMFEKGTALVFRESTIKANGKEKKRRASFLVTSKEISEFLSDYTTIESDIKSPEVESGIYFSHKDYGVVIGDSRRNEIDVVCIDFNSENKVLTNITGGVVYEGYVNSSKEVTLVAGLKKDESVKITLFDKKNKELEIREYTPQSQVIRTEEAAKDTYYPKFRIKPYRPLGLTHTIYAFSEDKEIAEKFIESRRIGYNLITGDGNVKSLSTKLKKQKITAINIFIPEGNEMDEKYTSLISSLKAFMKVIFISLYNEETNKTKTISVLIR
jgi:hypothetical protein